MAERDKGRAVLLVSLELDEVMNLSDRILVIYEGETIEVTRDKSGKISSFQKVRKNRMQELFTEFNPEAETFDGYTSEAKH